MAIAPSKWTSDRSLRDMKATEKPKPVFSLHESSAADTYSVSRSQPSYHRPELFLLGRATDLIMERAVCRSGQLAARIRRLIDESRGNLSFSPAKECEKFQISLSLVSRQFKKLYRVTMRAYSRQVRMETADKLLRESKNLNVDEAARALGYSFTSAFSRCFQNTFGKRPKRYQMQCGGNSEWVTAQENS
jgi:AraC-like DNA-binding protein